jgi:hypothetical protein
MCFYKLYTNSYGKDVIAKVKIAKTDIFCYKLLHQCGGGSENIKWISPYKQMQYFKSKCPKKGIEVAATFDQDHVTDATIHQGIHSYKLIPTYLPTSKLGAYFVSYIPKGTKYYYNPEDKKYVSEKLVVTPALV